MEKCGKRDGRNGGFAPEPRNARADGRGNEREAAPLRACSACAGDYEDPDRTAGMFDETESEERDKTLEPGAEEFPADDH